MVARELPKKKGGFGISDMARIDNAVDVAGSFPDWPKTDMVL